jgi:hypothetical protein
VIISVDDDERETKHPFNFLLAFHMHLIIQQLPRHGCLYPSLDSLSNKKQKENPMSFHLPALS